MTSAAFVVRAATPRDARALAALGAEVAAEAEAWLPAGRWRTAGEERRQLRVLARNSAAAAVLVADAPGSGIVGRLTVMRDRQPACHHVADVGLMVAAAWRRRGVGRALLNAAEEWARDHEVRKLELHVFPHNEAAIALYDAAGYRREGYRRGHFRREGRFLDAILMARTLAGSNTPAVGDLWASAASYEAYIGRWSRPVAREFVDWLGVAPGARWLDVGCGTGALTEIVLERAAPEHVTGVDPSEPFVRAAQERLGERAADFSVADARSLPFEDESFDAVAAALVLNFVPDPAAGAAEMARVSRPGGTVAAYVWDYAEGMQLLRYFWDAARAVAEDAELANEASRFPLCRPEPLEALFRDAGLVDVEVRAIDTPTRFESFDDLWGPFLAGQTPAPAYVMSLEDGPRERLRERLRESLPIAGDGSIPLTARAWAVRGRR